MTQLHPRTSITLTDAHGVPLAEIPVRHTYGDGETVTAVLPIQVSRQAEDALLAGIFRRLLTEDGPYCQVNRTPGRGGDLDLDGSVRLNRREADWLTHHYPHLKD